MKTIFFSTLILLASIAWAQDESERLDEKIDQITYDWDLEADKLSTYAGLQQLCTDEGYRTKILKLLDDIHHYDTVLYGVLVKLSKTSDDKEVHKTLKDIKKFEEEYDSNSFIHFMNEECKAMRDIERHSEDTANDVGINSYSGQVYLLETELYKYVKHITSRVDKIRLHVHHLSKHYGG
ncbi:MAG: hypothetical protein RLN88_10760 [Ekhidna sp.]|uniref:hypothetical protein n=1 Tax=Ekhidna sp. TaxID=2608089 RepID=UPI0032ECD1FF